MYAYVFVFVSYTYYIQASNCYYCDTFSDIVLGNGSLAAVLAAIAIDTALLELENNFRE